jgi:hypothetical protein
MASFYKQKRATLI